MLETIEVSLRRVKVRNSSVCYCYYWLHETVSGLDNARLRSSVSDDGSRRTPEQLAGVRQRAERGCSAADLAQQCGVYEPGLGCDGVRCRRPV